MQSAADLKKIASTLAAANPANCRVVTGFDGFIDEMITLVGERHSLDEFTAVPDIGSFGALVGAAAGHSSLREIVVNAVHPGGCAVNLADGIASLGVAVDCFATLGEPVHPAFGEIAGKCRGFHSWGREPGRTLAFEFNDGKLMFSAVKQLANFTPQAVRGYLTNGTFAEACAAAQVIAITDWTLYPHMTAVWRMLQDEVFSGLSNRPHFFIDLVDPSSRSAANIREMAATLRGFEASGPLTLGLNGNEANILCRLHDLPAAPADADAQDALQQAQALRELLGVSRVVVHRIAFAVSSSADAGFAQPGPFCPHPKKSTGAGDRFNAGFCLGLALGMDDADSLALGCAAAGFFVRHARSASHAELADFLTQWKAGTID
ncbi:MAG: PfkB family carbohydrate kinase [Verrucomicrobia bacterium]|nr:PfkB family carbohydrate kinase [Verrucomicrobiota bacterium]